METYVAVLETGEEIISNEVLRRKWGSTWDADGDIVILPKGSIKLLIGRELTYANEPWEIISK